MAALMHDLAVRRSAKEIIDNDLRRLADAIRLNTISSWSSFRESWDEVMSAVRLAMTRQGLSDAERNDLVTLLQEMQQKRQRMDTLGCIEPGRMPWGAQRKFIMSVNNWNEFGGCPSPSSVKITRISRCFLRCTVTTALRATMTMRIAKAVFSVENRKEPRAAP